MNTTNSQTIANKQPITMIRVAILATVMCLICLPVNAEVYIANALVETNKISPGMIKAIFLGEMNRWENGEPISLCVDVSNKAALDSFYKTRVGKNAASYRRHWTKRVFSGDASGMPRNFEKANKAISFVAAKEGALCFVDTVPTALQPGVKLLQVSN